MSSAAIRLVTLKLCGEEHFAKAKVSYIRGLAPGWAFRSIRDLGTGRHPEL